MISSLDKNSLYSSFGVNNFLDLEIMIENMAPSLVEYYLMDLYEVTQEVYFNKSDIQSSIKIGDYLLYIDYDENFFLEIDRSSFDDCTQSFW